MTWAQLSAIYEPSITSGEWSVSILPMVSLHFEQGHGRTPSTAPHGRTEGRFNGGLEGLCPSLRQKTAQLATFRVWS